MARTRKTGLALRAEVVPGEWQDHRRVVKLTAEILRLHERLARQVVGGVRAIGQRMAEIRDALPHGQWLKWLDEAVPFTPRTVNNYIMLAEWAARRPQDLERLGHLGPTKLYLLAPLAPADRRRLTGRTPVPIPDGTPKTIDAMTTAELRRVIAGSFTTGGGPRMPIDKVVQGIEHTIAGLDARVDVLIDRKDEVDTETAAQLHNELLELAAELAEGFEL